MLLPAPWGYERRGMARQCSVTVTACFDHRDSPCSREEEYLHVTPSFFMPVRISLPQQKPTGDDTILEKKKKGNVQTTHPKQLLEAPIFIKVTSVVSDTLQM